MKIVWIHGVGQHLINWWKPWSLEVLPVLQSLDAKIKIEDYHVSYNSIFEARGKPSVADTIEAVAKLGWSAAVHGVGDIFRRTKGLSAFEEQVRWTAGMVVQWTSDPVLRKELRDYFTVQLETASAAAGNSNLVVAAHSLGSLIAYDTLLSNPGLAKKCVLIGFGSQIGHPAVRSTFGGRLVAPAVKHWYHLFNKADRVFTSPLRLRAPHFTEIDATFCDDGFLNHSAVREGAPQGYLDGDAARSIVWPEVVSMLSGGKFKNLDGRVASGGNRKDLTVAAAPNSRHRALIIGINKTAHAAISELQGCTNDAFLMSSVLQECGLGAEGIRLLLDERATASAIRERLDWLLEGAEDGDFRVLCYSGHGVQMDSYGTGEIVDRADESLVPYDFNFTRDTGILDDDIRDLYAQLPYGVHFLALFDCCHADGVHRGAGRVRGVDPPDDIRHRAMRWDAGKHMWVDRALPSLSRGTQINAARKPKFFGSSGSVRRLGRAAVLREEPVLKAGKAKPSAAHLGPYLPVILQACGERQLASEYDHGATAYGAFSYCMAQVFRDLARRKKGVTYAELQSETQKRLADIGYEHIPEILGPTSKLSMRIPVGGTQSAKPRRKAAQKIALTSASPSEGGALPPRPPARRKPRTKDILGAETWSRVSPIDAPPWTGIALLDIRDSGGNPSNGSAFFIHPEVLVTAGHCLHVWKTDPLDDSSAGPVRSVEINIAQDDNFRPFTPRAPMHWMVAPEWETDAHPAHDYGLLFLSPGDAHDYWFGVPVDGLAGDVVNATVAGYPVSEKGTTLWRETGQVGISGAFIGYDLDTENGQSGGPVFMTLPGNGFQAIGIHTTGTPAANGAVLITPTLITRWQAWMNQVFERE